MKTKFYRDLSGFIGIYRDLSGFIGIHRDSWGFIGIYRDLWVFRRKKWGSDAHQCPSIPETGGQMPIFARRLAPRQIPSQRKVRDDVFASYRHAAHEDDEKHTQKRTKVIQMYDETCRRCARPAPACSRPRACLHPPPHLLAAAPTLACSRPQACLQPPPSLLAAAKGRDITAPC